MSMSVPIGIENALVIFAIWKDPFRELRGTRANYLILSLAICDFLIGIPGELSAGLSYLFPANNRLFLAEVGVWPAFTASCFTVISLSVERLVVVSCPLRSADHLTRPLLILWIILIWVIASLQACILLIWKDLYFFYAAYIFADVLGIATVIIVCACYTRIYFVVRKSLYLLEERQGRIENARTVERLKRKERSAACTVFILVATYIICWIPVYVLQNLDKPCDCSKFSFWEYTLSSFHPLLNPLVYSLCTPKFRRALLKIWRESV